MALGGVPAAEVVSTSSPVDPTRSELHAESGHLTPEETPVGPGAPIAQSVLGREEERTVTIAEVNRLTHQPLAAPIHAEDHTVSIASLRKLRDGAVPDDVLLSERTGPVHRPPAERTVTTDQPRSEWTVRVADLPTTRPVDPDLLAAADPSTPLHELMRIAEEKEDLRATIAANPSTYPDLLTWLGTLGDPQVDAALASRR